jgi:HPt (histidine-containing phosphotransfer) domain-containing protein
VRPVTSDWHPEPPVDEAALLELLGNDRELALELFHVFTEDMNHQRSALHAAALAGDIRGLIRLAHRLKGGTLNLGCTGAAVIAAEIEQHAGALEPSRMESLVRALDFEIDRCVRRMAVLRQAWSAGH